MSSSHLFFGLPIIRLVLYFELISGHELCRPRHLTPRTTVLLSCQLTLRCAKMTKSNIVAFRSGPRAANHQFRVGGTPSTQPMAERQGSTLSCFWTMFVPWTAPERTSSVYNILADQFWTVVGVRLHTCKTRDVWNSVLGTSVGSQHFVHRSLTRGSKRRRKLWGAIAWGSRPPPICLTDLAVCRLPLSHHFLRKLPPSQSANCAIGRGLGMQTAMGSLLGEIPGCDAERGRSPLGHSPMRMGGLGLRSTKMAPGTFWASWAVALLVEERLPTVAEGAVIALEDDDSLEGC